MTERVARVLRQAVHTVRRASQGLMSAPAYPLPDTQFYSIEYPGYIKPTSVPYAIRTLGGQTVVESAFKRTANKAETILELNFRPGNPFAHPVPGEVVHTNNILMKVVKRKRRRALPAEEGEPIGEFTVEALGVIPKTVRFRSAHPPHGSCSLTG